MGRSSSGLKGIKLATNDELVAALRIEKNSKMIIITESGYGKRVEFDNFTPHGRGTGGMKVYNISEKSGEIVGAITIADEDDIVCITSQGKTLRFKSTDIKEQGAGASGVKIVKITEPDYLVGIDKVEEKKDDDYAKKVDEAFNKDPANTLEQAGLTD